MDKLCGNWEYNYFILQNILIPYYVQRQRVIFFTSYYPNHIHDIMPNTNTNTNTN